VTLKTPDPEYRVPQFVADLARRRGLRGILYDSTRPSAYNNPEAVGHNLVVFDPIPVNTIDAEAVFQFGEPDYDPFWSRKMAVATCAGHGGKTGCQRGTCG